MPKDTDGFCVLTVKMRANYECIGDSHRTPMQLTRRRNGMKKKNFMITALILTACVTATLASCGGRNNTPTNGSSNGERVTSNAESDRKETAGGIVNDAINGAENIGDDIADSIKNPEDATHGTEEVVTDRTENNMITDGNDDAMRHRPSVPYGK